MVPKYLLSIKLKAPILIGVENRGSGCRLLALILRKINGRAQKKGGKGTMMMHQHVTGPTEPISKTSSSVVG